MSEINVTPLVDVMLVLLIIFMVAAPMMTRGIDLDLPETKTARDVAEERTVVTVNREGTLFLNDRPVHAELFGDQIRKLMAGRPGEGVYLKADRDLPYGRVLRVMDQIRLAGVERIAMITNPVTAEETGAGTSGGKPR